MVDIRISSFAASFADRAGYPQETVSDAKGFLAAIEDIRAENGAAAGSLPDEFAVRAKGMITTLTEEAIRFGDRGAILAGQEDGDIDSKVSIVESGLKEIDRTIRALKQHISR
jgi:hypothetical protein